MKSLFTLLPFFVCNLALTQSPIWQQTNGPFGGEIISLGVDSSGTLFAGNRTFIEVFRSTDNGTSWTRSITAYSFGFAALPNGNVLAASTFRVLKSTDHGISWLERSSGLNGAYLNAIAVLDTTNVIAGAYSGIFRSTDSGDSWFPSNTGLSSLDVRAICVGRAGIIFVGTSTGDVLSSMDRGASWNPCTRDSSYNGVSSIVQNAAGTIFLGTTQGVYKSTNNGTVWSHKTTGVVNSLQIDEDGNLFAATLYGGVYLSTDNGETWQATNVGLTTLGINAVLVGSNGIIIAGTSNRGVFSSFDHGTHWIQTGVTNSIVDVLLCAGKFTFAVSSGPRSIGLFRTSDLGNQWTQITPDYQGGFSCMAKNDSNTLFAGWGPYIMRSADFGLTWTNLFGTLGEGAFLTSIVVHPSGAIICGAKDVLVSLNSQTSWQRIPFPTNVGVRCLALSPNGNVFAGATNGVYCSTDIGMTWNLTGLQNRDVTAIIVGLQNQVVAAGVANGDSIFLSSDNGDNWINSYSQLGITIVNGFAVNSAGDFFAATDGKGVMSSTDGGHNWSDVGPGLTTRYVESVLVDHEGFLYAGTYGEGVFRSVKPTTSVNQYMSRVPARAQLFQNYPNPFNPITSIPFSIPRLTHVSLIVFDVLGREVAVLVNDERVAGSYTVNWNAEHVSSGVYFYQLQADRYAESRRMLLIR